MTFKKIKAQEGSDYANISLSFSVDLRTRPYMPFAIVLIILDSVSSHVSVSSVADFMNHAILGVETRNFIEHSVQVCLLASSLDTVIVPGLFARIMDWTDKASAQTHHDGKIRARLKSPVRFDNPGHERWKAILNRWNGTLQEEIRF